MKTVQGLKNNITQFTLLVFLNFLVGAVVGIERSSFFNFAETKFHLQEGSFLISFLIAFGLSKASANLLTSKILNYKSKKWLLVFGWLMALPGVLLLIFANVWWHVILANVFIGLNQGFCWSSNVLLKIDLVGNKQRGLSMGFNEFSGYLAVGVLSILSGYIIFNFNFNALFYVLLSIVIVGLVISLLLVKDTKHLLKYESDKSKNPTLNFLFKKLTISHSQLSPITINGFANNLIDGAYWLMLPIMLVKQNYSIEKIGFLVSIYPIVWAVAQLFTGKLGDVYCRKQLITVGMILQIIGLIFTAYSSIVAILIGSVFIGIGTAFVYPNFLTEVSSVLHPSQRAIGLSYFRFWRDMGYVGGALLIGILLPILSTHNILITVALLTTFTTIYAEIKMCCVLKYFWRTRIC